MPIVPDLFDTVGYIGVIEDKKFVWRGTCFFIEEPADGYPGKIWGYLVTALHVAEQVADRKFAVRLNARKGGYALFPVEGGAVRWWIHPDDANVDIAVFRWLPDETIVTTKRLPTALFVTQADVDAQRVGPGDNINMFGLLTYAPGENRNSPVVRSGIVAMLPDGPISTKRGLMEAYLVEAVSVGGLSGSPVIVMEATSHRIGNVQVRGIGDLKLLGVVHGHWDFEIEHDDMTGKLQKSASIHSGLTVVVPAKRIREIIEQPEMIEIKRTDALKKWGEPNAE
jgi:hypothetical protein